MADMAPRRRRRRRAEPMRAADALARFRRRAGGAAGAAGGAGAAAAAWPRVVGEQAARHSAPVRLSRAGVLTVACASAAWAQELSARQEELAGRLRALLPDAGVARLRFAVADHVPVAAAPEPAPAPRAVRPPNPAELAEGRRAAAAVADPRLAELIARAAASAAARSSGGETT